MECAKKTNYVLFAENLFSDPILGYWVKVTHTSMIKNKKN